VGLRPRLRVPIRAQALARLRRSGGQSLGALATQLELIGLSHHLDVAALEKAVGRDLVARDPRAVFAGALSRTMRVMVAVDRIRLPPSSGSMPRPKAILSWSSGKDSAFALHETRKFGEVEIVGLLTTLTSSFGRVSMHGVREALLDRQAEAVGLPCWKVMIPSPCPNEVYEREMASTLAEVARDGVRHVVFGDLFLEDLRRYREDRLAQIGMSAVFPLWMRNTAVLAREMIAAGLEARITCVDPRKLDRSFAGRAFEPAFLEDLPSSVDPCGENGEFHTFAWAGPMFSRAIENTVGDVVERDGFVFADVLPVDARRH
jgi:uncharacterized protein (TIGR00290 family)